MHTRSPLPTPSPASVAANPSAARSSSAYEMRSPSCTNASRSGCSLAAVRRSSPTVGVVTTDTLEPVQFPGSRTRFRGRVPRTEGERGALHGSSRDRHRRGFRPRAGTARLLAEEGAPVAVLDLAADARREDSGRDRRAGRDGPGLRRRRRRPRLGHRRSRGRGRRPRPTPAARELRGRAALRALGAGDGRGLAEAHQRQPQRHVLHVPGHAAVPARRRRRDRERRLERRAHGPAVHRRVLRVEGRRREPHPGAGRRVPEEGRARERDRARRA